MVSGNTIHNRIHKTLQTKPIRDFFSLFIKTIHWLQERIIYEHHQVFLTSSNVF